MQVLYCFNPLKSNHMYYDEEEVLEHFDLETIPPTTVSDRPKNPKTGRYYSTNSWKYWLWWYGLCEEDKSFYADLEAQEYM